MTLTRNGSLRRFLLPGLAIFAMLWVIARAHVQSMTVDEATTYGIFVAPPHPWHWAANANNHVLNSMLARLSTLIFGASHLTVRAGALLGAAIYISAAYLLSKLIASGLIVRVALFVCLVYNPFIFDFMVAARGYGLGIGFLTAAIYVVAARILSPNAKPDASVVKAACLSSACAALSFSSNFSFAFVDTSLLFMLFLWSCQAVSGGRSGWGGRMLLYLKLAAAFTLPGLFVAAALVGSTVLQYPRDNLVYGAKSLLDTFSSIAAATLYEPNAFLISPLFYDEAVRLSAVVLPLLGLMCLWRLFTLTTDGQSLRRDEFSGLFWLGSVIAGTFALTVLLHWTAFQLAHVLLPKDRTAIYLVVLITIFVGVLAAIPSLSRLDRISRRGLLASLLLLGTYFIACLRLTYFKEWKFDSDMRNTYAVLAFYNHTCGLREAPANWRYDASLNFYWTISRREDFVQFYSNWKAPYPPAKLAYVLYEPDDLDFISQNGLKVVYRGDNGVVIALNPALGSTCPTVLPPFGIR